MTPLLILRIPRIGITVKAYPVVNADGLVLSLPPAIEVDRSSDWAPGAGVPLEVETHGLATYPDLAICFLNAALTVAMPHMNGWLHVRGLQTAMRPMRV